MELSILQQLELVCVQKLSCRRNDDRDDQSVALDLDLRQDEHAEFRALEKVVRQSDTCCRQTRKQTERRQ